MALWRFSNKTKNNNWRHRIIHLPDGKPFSHGPGFGQSVAVKRFRYEHNHTIAPALVVMRGKKFIVPTWTEVHSETTLKDIEWIKPIKIEAPVEKETWKFESSSEKGLFYKVTKQGDKLTCNCSGFFRCKDRSKGCKHVQEVRKQLGK